MGYTSDDADYPYPAARPWSMLSYEAHSYKVMELAQKEIDTIQDILENPEGNSGYAAINAETRYNKEYVPQYEEWSARTNSQPIKGWFDSSKSFQRSDDFTLKERVEKANSQYKKLIDDKKKEEFARTVNDCTKFTVANTDTLKSFTSTPINPFQPNFDPATMQNFRDSLSQGMGHYADLKYINSGKLFTEKPMPTHEGVNPDELEEPWQRWLSLEKETKALIVLQPADSIKASLVSEWSKE